MGDSGAFDRLLKDVADVRTSNGTLKEDIVKVNAEFEELCSRQNVCNKARIKQKKELKRIRAEFARVRKAQSLTEAQCAAYEDAVDQAELELKDIRTRLPEGGNWYVSAVMGHKINVRFFNRNERLGFKKEYEDFKRKMIPVFLAMVAVCLYAENRWCDIAFHLMSVYYYSSLALREYILKINGSRIRTWWSVHHIVSVMLTVVELTWPWSPLLLSFRTAYFRFAGWQAVLQYMQTRYQMARLYTMRALGRASSMDIANTDNPAYLAWFSGMSWLMPFILVAHAQQFHMSYFLLWHVWLGEHHHGQALLCGLLFGFLGAGNLIALVRTILDKRKVAATRRKTAPALQRVKGE